MSSPQWSQLRKYILKQAHQIEDSKPLFKTWLNKFVKSEVQPEGRIKRSDYPVVLALEETYRLDKTRTGQLLLEVLKACYQAATFRDQSKNRRLKDREVLDNIPSQLKAIHTIKNFLVKYPGASSSALAQAYLIWKEKHATKEAQFLSVKGLSLSFSDLFTEFLDCYADELNRGILGVKSGDFLYRFKAGPILYRNPLDHQKAQPDVKLNGLIFHLVFLYRQYTSPQPLKYRERGSPLPHSGKPCFPLVTLLTNATLFDNDQNGGVDIDGVRARIQELKRKQVGLTSWRDDIS